jgi:hypothetical protein
VGWLTTPAPPDAKTDTRDAKTDARDAKTDTRDAKTDTRDAHVVADAAGSPDAASS